MNKNIIISCLCFIFFSFSPLQTHDFFGRHFIASYKGCNEQALHDTTKLITIFKEAVQSTGATILKCDCVEFPGGGLTIFIVLSESHASIHTYPEYNACFVDLFTCGNNCSHEPFDKILTDYLQSKDGSKQLYIRE